MQKIKKKRLPKGYLEKVAKEMKVSKITVWRRIHIYAEPSTLSLLNKMLFENKAWSNSENKLLKKITNRR